MFPNIKQPDPIPVNLPPVPPVHWTTTRIQIRDWLYEQAPSLAELYESAVHLMFEIRLPSRVRLVSHCVREICNRLLVITLEEKSGGWLDYVKRMDQIAQIWEAKGFKLDGTFPESGISLKASLPSSSPDISIPRDLFLAIAKLIKNHAETTSKLEERPMRFFAEYVPENQYSQDTLRPQVIQWRNLTKWFVGKVHDNGKVDADYNEQELLSRFDIFESFLGTLASSFYSTTDELDEILEDANSSTD